MFSRLRCIPTVALLVLTCPVFVLAAAKAKPEKAKAEKTPAATNGKVAGQLQKTFKLWDKNKDGSADKEELEKFYAKLKVKPKRKGVAAAGEPDPMAPVNALRSKADADGDDKISLAEFNEWATNFTEYASKVSALQIERAGSEREMANLQGLLDRSGKVTAADGIFEQEARRGLITYKQSLERIDGELKALDAEGHSDYVGLFMPQGR